MLTKKGTREELLVQWVEQVESEATWESKLEFTSAYPGFDLEDKITFNGNGNDTSGVGQSGAMGPDTGCERPKRVIRRPTRFDD